MSQPISEENFFFFLFLFWIILYGLGRIFDFEKHGLKILPGFLMYRSKRLKRLLDSMSKRWRRLWMILSNVGLALAFGLMAFGIYFLVDGILKLTYTPEVASPVVLTVPGVTIQLYWLPYFFVAVAIVAITHELAHGIVALSEGIPVKSAGLFSALVFFGGFVEPDKEGFEKSSVASKVRTVCAGSSANLVTCFLVMLLMTSLFAQTGGVLIYETIENGPVDRAGLQRWDAIYAINGSRILTTQDFQNYMAKVTPSQTLILETNKGNKTIVTQAFENRTIIGIRAVDYYPSRLGLDHSTTINLYWTLSWTQLIALSAAVFNMLPIYTLDGDKLVQSILERVLKKWANEARVLVNVAFFGLLAANIILSFIKYGLVSI